MEGRHMAEEGLMDDRERRFINSWAKHLFQKHFEMRIYAGMLQRRGISLVGGSVLDAGCGAGFGLKLIRERLCPGRLVGIDLDAGEIGLSWQLNVADELYVGDLARTQLPSSSFDAVFAFTVLHHMPFWKMGVAEVARVLKEGGLFLVNEHNARSVHMLDRLFGVRHPKSARFSWSQLEDEMEANGLQILEKRSYFGLFGFYLCKKGAMAVPAMRHTGRIGTTIR